MRALKLLAYIISVILLPVLSGCYACTRHISSVRPAMVQPDASLSEKYRLTSLSVAHGSKKDQEKMFTVVKKSLLVHYPHVFTDSADAIPLSVHVTWQTQYHGSPIVHSFLSNIVIPDTAEQETIYYVSISATGANASWSDRTSASRLSETWETWLLPIGFLPIPGKSDWSRTFCFLRLGKDSLVSSPKSVINSANCVRDMVFDPKVDGDVIAAAIMRAINRQHRLKAINAMMKEGGAK